MVESPEEARGNDAKRGHEFFQPPENSRAARIGRRWPITVRAPGIALLTITAYVGLLVVLLAIGLLLKHVLSHGSVGDFDHRVSHWFTSRRTNTWNLVTTIITFLADAPEIAAMVVIASGVLIVRHWGRRSVLLLLAFAIELSVFLTSNFIVARQRPTVKHLGGTPGTYGFPSGHSAAAIALYGGLALLITATTDRRFVRFLAWTAAVLLAIAVGISRVYRGEHFPTDVIAGFILGVGSLLLAQFIVRISCTEHDAPGGAGISSSNSSSKHHLSGGAS